MLLLYALASNWVNFINPLSSKNISFFSFRSSFGFLKLSKMNKSQSFVTPLSKQAIILSHYLFFYLFPAKLSLEIDPKNKTIILKNRPFHWKLLPWLIILLISTFGWIVTPCYLIISQLLQRPPKLELHILCIIVGLTIGTSLELFAYYMLYKHPEIVNTFNAVFHLEQKCTWHNHFNRIIYIFYVN